MDRKRYEELHREFRQLEQAFNKLCVATSKHILESYRPARVLIVQRQSEIRRAIGDIEFFSADILSTDYNEALGMGITNRMEMHPTPKLKGI